MLPPPNKHCSLETKVEGNLLGRAAENKALPIYSFHGKEEFHLLNEWMSGYHQNHRSRDISKRQQPLVCCLCTWYLSDSSEQEEEQAVLLPEMLMRITS